MCSTYQRIATSDPDETRSSASVGNTSGSNLFGLIGTTEAPDLLIMSTLAFGTCRGASLRWLWRGHDLRACAWVSARQPPTAGPPPLRP